jgi:hypothetical protein
MKGHTYRKGKQTEYVKKKVERFKLGLLIECKKHGEHLKWRLHSENNVQCLFCANEWQMNQRRRNPLIFIFRDAKRHAVYHKRVFNIEIDDLIRLMEVQNGKCALSGVEFTNDIPPSLDRIDSTKGYIASNIQLIQIKINLMKSNLEQEEFINLCKLVTKRN